MYIYISNVVLKINQMFVYNFHKYLTKHCASFVNLTSIPQNIV